LTTITSKDIIEKWQSGLSIDWKVLTTDEKKEWLLACLFEKGLPKGTIPIGNYKVDGSKVNKCYQHRIRFNSLPFEATLA
jgi:hypothetical protein